MNRRVDNEIEALCAIYFDNIRIILEETNKIIQVTLLPYIQKGDRKQQPYCWIKVRIEYLSQYPEKGPLISIYDTYNIAATEIELLEKKIVDIIEMRVKENVEMVLEICEMIHSYIENKTKVNEPNDNDNNFKGDIGKNSPVNHLANNGIKFKRSIDVNDNPLEKYYNDHTEEINFTSNQSVNNDNNNNSSNKIEDNTAIQSKKEEDHESKGMNMVSRFTSDFDKKEMLGEGGGGSVYRVQNKWDGMYYAIKMIKVNIYNAANERNVLLRVLNEGYVLSRLQHPHIVRYYQTWVEEDNGSSTSEDDSVIDSRYDIDSDSDCSNTNSSISDGNIMKKALFIQMEWCEGKTLKEAIENKALSEMQKWKLIIQLLEAVNYIHQQSLIHRDIKPGNIFLDKNNEVKIGDFGLAKINKKKQASTLNHSNNTKEHISINNGNELMTYNIGTKYYCSPEQEKTKTYGSKSDMFSIGIILFEMFHSFASLIERDTVLRKIKDQHVFPDSFIQSNKSNIVELVSILTERDPSHRPTAKELLTSSLIPVIINEKAVTENFEKIINDNQDYTEKFIDILIKSSSSKESNHHNIRDHYYTKLFRKYLKELPKDLLERFNSISLRIISFHHHSFINFQCKEIAPFNESSTLFDSINKEVIHINLSKSPWRQDNIMLNRFGKLLQFNTITSLFKEISSYIGNVQNIGDFYPCQLYSEMNYEVISTQLWSSADFCDNDAKYIISSIEKMFSMLNMLNIDTSKIVIKVNSSRILDMIISKSSAAFPNNDKKYEMLNDIQKGKSIKNQKMLHPFMSINGELETIKKKYDHKKEFINEIDAIVSLFNSNSIYWNDKNIIKYYREKIKIDFSLISSYLLFYSGIIIQVVYQGNDNEDDIVICEGGNVDNLLHAPGTKELFFHGFAMRYFIERLMIIKPVEEEIPLNKTGVLIVCCEGISEQVMSDLYNKIPNENKGEIELIMKPQKRINYKILENVYKMKMLIVVGVVNEKIMFDLYHKDKIKQIKEEEFKWSDINQIVSSLQYKKKR